jgi:superfamily II DNA or RNA helicase
MSLRPYQLDAIAKVRDAMRDGAKRVVLVVPTGGGKTRIASEVVRAGVAKGRRWVWIAHRTELVGQACQALTQAGLDVGAVAAGSDWPERPGAPVQVASIQTLLARSHRPEADGIVWDECHHCAESAAEWSSLLAGYPSARVMGLTATPERADGSGLAPLFDRLVVGASVRALTLAGHLVPCEIVRPSRWLREGGAKGNPLSQPPLAAYQEHTPGQSCILFARTIEESEAYAAEFTAAGIRAVSVSQRTGRVERAAAIEAFRRGHVKVLCNVYVFTEGTDLPNANVCLMARGASTVGMVLQMVGRVLRPYPGKTSATWLDLQGISHVHGVPEDEREFRLEGRAIVKVDALCKVCQAPWTGPPCAQCGYAPEAGDDPESATTITNDPLAKYARKLAESPEQRKETLGRWLVQLALKGQVPGRIIHKWRAVYGCELSREWYFRGLADCTHSENDIVAEWAKMHLARIRSRRAA